jgi:hypothetical protein
MEQIRIRLRKLIIHKTESLPLPCCLLLRRMFNPGLCRFTCSKLLNEPITLIDNKALRSGLLPFVDQVQLCFAPDVVQPEMHDNSGDI